MKIYIFIMCVALGQFATAMDAKKILNIEDVNLDTLKVEESIKTLSIIANLPKESTAITYVLYGSAKVKSNQKEAHLFDYNDRILSDKIILDSKFFLMNVAMSHTNESTRAMASMTIGFAFPKDDEIVKWLGEWYFSPDVTIEKKIAILGIIRIGKYKTLYTDLIIKAALMGTNPDEISNAASCIKENSSNYAEFLPDLISSILTLESKRKIDKDFESNKKLNITYFFLVQAINKYGNEISPYLGLLEKNADEINNESLKLFLIKKVSSPKS